MISARLRTILTYLFLAVALTSAAAGREEHPSPRPSGRRPDLPKAELRLLDKAIKESPEYEAVKMRSLDSITRIYDSSPDPLAKWRLAVNLVEKYRQVNTDSSLNFAQRAIDLSEHLSPDCLVGSRIALVKALATAGIFTQARSEFESIPLTGVPDSLYTSYWFAGRILYGYMRTYVADHDKYYRLYDSRYQQYDDSLMRHLPASSDFRTFLICERLVSDGRLREAKEKLSSLLARLSPDSNLYGMAAFQMAEACRLQGDETEYAAYLAKAAVSDVKGCVKEGFALPTLADWLYRQGEVDAAFGFINFALEDAASGNARMRTASIARLVPFIDDAYRSKIDSSRNELMAYFLLATFLLIVCAVLLFVLMRQSRRSRDDAKKLSVTSRLLESYVGNFIELCSTYSERLDRLTKLVNRKLSSGQADELLNLLKSGKLTDEADDADFYKVFDHAFLDIYPKFVDEVNALLLPGKRLSLRVPGTLTPELRIYALARLGVSESTRIAQILRYSPSTVYTYRHRMRSRAVNSDSFEKDVINIGSLTSPL